MTRARVLADYVAGETTAAEFEEVEAEMNPTGE